MPRRKSIRVILDFDPGSEPIAGRLTGRAGASHSFIGWLELVAAIDGELELSDADLSKAERAPPASRDI